MTHFLFELRLTVRELTIQAGAAYRFEYGGAHDVTVILSAPSDVDQGHGHRAVDAFCVASSKVEPKEEALEVFSAIGSNAITTANASRAVGTTAYPGPDGAWIRIPPLFQFPERFRSFLESVMGDLRDFARRTVSVLRWRSNHLGPHNPFSSRGMYWSSDGSFWHPAPDGLRARLWAVEPVSISGEVYNDTKQIVIDGGTEPLPHDLIREALDQRHSNPRSAMVLGMAAAELAVKHCVGVLVPQAEWLAMNLLTPPLVKMLREYVPKLPVRCRIGDQVKAPPESVMALLKKGSDIRNGLAHAGAAAPPIHDVEEILDAVRDLLWLLDYYAGYEWALGFVRSSTRKELGAA